MSPLPVPIWPQRKGQLLQPDRVGRSQGGQTDRQPWTQRCGQQDRGSAQGPAARLAPLPGTLSSKRRWWQRPRDGGTGTSAPGGAGETARGESPGSPRQGETNTDRERAGERQERRTEMGRGDESGPPTGHVEPPVPPCQAPPTPLPMLPALGDLLAPASGHGVPSTHLPTPHVRLDDQRRPLHLPVLVLLLWWGELG